MNSAVIFDHDGVLADSEPLQKKSFDLILSRYGITVPETEFRSFVGKKAVDAFRGLIREYDLPLTVDDFAAEKNRIYRSLLEKELKPVPGILGILDFLHTRGIPMAVVSGSPRIDLDLAFRYFGISEYFKAVVSGEDVKKGKPDPEGFLKAAASLGVMPSRIYVLEDSGPGVLAAANCGMTGIAVPGPLTYDHDFAPAKHVFPSFEGVLAFFKEIFDKKR